MVMKTLNEIISILKEYKKTMSSQYGIKRLGVFGSVARGEPDYRLYSGIGLPLSFCYFGTIGKYQPYIIEF